MWQRRWDFWVNFPLYSGVFPLKWGEIPLLRLLNLELKGLSVYHVTQDEDFPIRSHLFGTNR